MDWVQLVVGGVLTALGGVGGVLVAHKLERSHRDAQQELQKFAVLAERRLSAYLEFHLAYKNFLRERWHPRSRHDAVEAVDRALSGLYLAGDPDALDDAIPLVVWIHQEERLLQEYVVSDRIQPNEKEPPMTEQPQRNAGDATAQAQRKPVYRRKQDPHEVQERWEEFVRLEMAFLSTARRTLGFEGEGEFEAVDPTTGQTRDPLSVSHEDRPYN